MRVSTATTYMVGTYDMQSLQSSLQKLQLQLDTQKRVVTPADDPVAAARILQLTQSDGRNTQFIANNKAVESTLSMSETALTQSSDLLSTIKSLAIQAGNAALDDSQLKMLQQQLQGNINEMVGYANSTDGRGNYLFSGDKVDVAPFVLDGSTFGVTYQGDSGQRDVQISPSRQMQISEAGSNVFGDGLATGTLFKTLQDFNKLLGDGRAGAAVATPPYDYSAQLSTVLANLDSAQNTLSQSVASIGARRSENDNVQNMGEDLTLQYQTSISNLQDLDMPKAISDFTMAHTSLQYSQQIYSKMMSLSLFNYIS